MSSEKWRFRKQDEKTLSDDFSRVLGRTQKNETQKDDDTNFSLYLAKFSEFDKDIIKKLVKFLLVDKQSSFGNLNNKDYRSFVYHRNFSLYFTNLFLNHTVSAKEFETLRVGEYCQYQKFIFDLIKGDRISEVLDRLAFITHFNSMLEWENHHKILRELALFRYEKGIHFDSLFREISVVLDYPKNEKNYSWFSSNSKEYYKNYILEYFRDDAMTRLLKSEILNSSTTYSFETITVLDEDEKLEIKTEYFINYTKENNEVTNEFFVLYRNTRFNGPYDKYESSEKVEKVFKEYFVNKLKGSQLTYFIKHSSPETDFFRIDYEWLNQIFGENDDSFEDVYRKFEEFLDNSKNIKIEQEYFDEFNVFWKKIKGNGYTEVEFVFDKLEPVTWSSGTKTKRKSK